MQITRRQLKQIIISELAEKKQPEKGIKKFVQNLKLARQQKKIPERLKGGCRDLIEYMMKYHEDEYDAMVTDALMEVETFIDAEADEADVSDAIDNIVQLWGLDEVVAEININNVCEDQLMYLKSIDYQEKAGPWATGEATEEEGKMAQRYSGVLTEPTRQQKVAVRVSNAIKKVTGKEPQPGMAKALAVGAMQVAIAVGAGVEAGKQGYAYAQSGEPQAKIASAKSKLKK